MTCIYTPKGKAREYAELALNIYYGCPHKCSYCYVPAATFRQKDDFHASVRPSKLDIKAGVGNVLLCFTSDPYPNGYDHAHTQEAIRRLHVAGYRPVVLTKNPAAALLHAEDLIATNAVVGTTITCGDEMAKEHESGAPLPSKRLEAMKHIAALGLDTWISVEPVLEPDIVENLVKQNQHICVWKFGKLNHVKNTTDWVAYAAKVEEIIKSSVKRWMIKKDLWKVRKWGIAQSCNASF